MVNTLAVFGLAATCGLGLIMGSALAMCWLEGRLLGGPPPRRERRSVLTEQSGTDVVDASPAPELDRARVVRSGGSSAAPAQATGPSHVVGGRGRARGRGADVRRLRGLGVRDRRGFRVIEYGKVTAMSLIVITFAALSVLPRAVGTRRRPL